MKLSLFKVSLSALGFLVPLVSAKAALAAATCRTNEGTVVTVVDVNSCHFEFGGGCTSQCTPFNFTATCSEMCHETAATVCTNTCETKCHSECTTRPATFTCHDYCSTNCEAGCMAECTGDSCSADCAASCDTQCTESCQVHPGATSCSTECHDCCEGSCTVQANVQCNVGCSDTLTGGCTAKCEAPSGGLFCDGQFIDIDDVSACSFDLSFALSGGGSFNASTSCSAAPAGSSPLGLPIGIAGVAALALVATRRRRA